MSCTLTTQVKNDVIVRVVDAWTDMPRESIVPSCLIRLAFVTVLNDVNIIVTHNFLIKVALSNCHVRVSYLVPECEHLSTPHCLPHHTLRNMLKVSSGTKPARKRSIVSFSEDNPTVIGVSDGPQSSNQDQASPEATAGQLPHVTSILSKHQY